MNRLFFALFLALLAFLPPPGPARAQEWLGAHGAWNVIVYDEGGTKYCYIHSEPTKSEGDFAKRGTPYALVLRVKGGQDQVSVTSGYPYKAESSVEVVIGEKKLAFFTKDEKAFAPSNEDDAAMVKAMKGGMTMTVKGFSQKGTYSLDRYSLTGFTAAHKEMVKACS